MDELELWGRGLMTLALGPDTEWHPTSPAEYQWFHAQFWAMVTELVPEDEKDEPYWMTEAAAARLENN
jgi:hypothetical protein